MEPKNEGVKRNRSTQPNNRICPDQGYFPGSLSRVVEAGEGPAWETVSRVTSHWRSTVGVGTRADHFAPPELPWGRLCGGDLEGRERSWGASLEMDLRVVIR